MEFRIHFNVSLSIQHCFLRVRLRRSATSNSDGIRLTQRLDDAQAREVPNAIVACGCI